MSQTTMSDPRAAARDLALKFEEPREVAALREAALDAYLDSPLPNRVQHLWRYSDPEAFVPRSEALASAAGVAPIGGALPDELQGRVSSGSLAGAVFTDGTGCHAVRLSPEAERAGVVVLDLHRAAREKTPILRERLGRLVGGSVTPEGRGKFEALNLALWGAGTFIHVPRNVRLEKPIALTLSLGTGLESFLATRLLVVLEEGAELTVVDECEGGGEGLQLNSVFELAAGQASRLRHVAVQRLGRGVRYHVTQRVSVGRDANILTATATLGGGLTKSSFGSYLEGPGSSVELVGFLFGEGRQQFDHHTIHDHRSGHSHSNLDFKVVLKDRARSAYTGLIRIEKDAPQSEAYQENRNLLLSDSAKAESVPELEILTDDVKCTHGATMGSLDPEHLFYLMSRGLARSEAIRLIVGGFVEPTLSRVPDDLRERLRAQVEERIQDL